MDVVCRFFLVLDDSDVLDGTSSAPRMLMLIGMMECSSVGRTERE